ncbi:acyl CoA:acetate/3-ketoacid CoA transferase [Rubrivivax rivuli]|uniref:Acetate CoA-transferase YdiF n=1 Tax=Rubrivivax rivuli TaxID=1862385 RepID=A0A437RH95_9BURK|nr:CoA-transferase [Rubrivivax rivuli]RVU46147.1 acyl CoA:acetate/3-ketoacid CoA transferase [Rubrivivax rivuli]
MKAPGPRWLSADEAAALVQPGWTVASAGFVGAGHAEAVTEALERRFLATGLPRDLTLVYSAGQGDRGRRGVNHFGNPGMVQAVCGGHWRSATRLSALALTEGCAAWNLPQGVITHLYRAIAAGQPGLLSRVGLHTFVDPRGALDGRYQGGALNQRALAAQALPVAQGGRHWVEAVTLRGEDFLFYPAFPIHCAVLRATAADERGNLSAHGEAFHHELLALAQATRNSGGLVIAQVRERVAHHAALAPIRVPGHLVDVVVHNTDPELHRITFGEQENEAYLHPWRGDVAPAAAPAPEAPLDARTLVQRRAVLELAAGGTGAHRVVNLGVGMPAAVGAMAQAAGVGGYTLSVEAGPIGGTPADGLSFGASAWPEAVVDQPAQFDFYDGGGIDLAVLGMAELDAAGNVNVSRFGSGEQALIAGVGGFINITQGAKALVFVGTLTAGGLQVQAEGGRLRIVQEGRLQKLVPAVAHLSYNAAYMAARGQRVRYITERAVFEMRADPQAAPGGAPRLTLIEIAPGLDLQRDVLNVCGASVAVAADLREMDARIFSSAPLKL